MSETTDRPTRGDERDREIDAKHRLEQVQTDLRVAENRIRGLAHDMRDLQAQKGTTAEDGHRVVDTLQEVSEARFQAALADYLPTLKTVVRDAADPPSADLVTAFVLARDERLYEELHAAVDRDVDDNSTSTYVIATEAELDTAIVEKRVEQKAAREQVEKLESAQREAEAEYDDSIEGR